MKRKLNRIITVTVCLLLSAVFSYILLVFTQPMDDKIYDLSLTSEGEAVPDGWIYDQKGWSVFTQEGNTVSELTPDGFGGFTGLGYPGQTFYFSRILTENLNAPTLRLGAVNRGIAVFLDGELLYTDCFGENCEIGFLSLPMLDWDRTEPVVVTLPADYRGKTLTVAQATSPYGSELQSQELKVWPCSAVLYCGYAYESSLIAECFQAGIPATALFLMGVVLLVFFGWQVFHGKADIGLMCAAMAAFLWMTSRMAMTSFAYNYFGLLPIDVILLCRDISRIALLAFLASRCTGKRRIFLAALTGLQGLLTALFALFQLLNWYPFGIVSRTDAFGLFSLLAALILGFMEWRQERSLFYIIFCSLTSVGIVIYTLIAYVKPSFQDTVERLLQGLAGYFLLPLTGIMMAVAIIAGVSVAIRREMERRIEARLLAQRQALAQASYESMRKHHDQVMILRHDIAKHLHLLRQMTREQDVAGYLDELIGENEKIPLVIQCGNEMLDIILNGTLSVAADAGIHIEFVRMQAPAALPLSSRELCSLFMNVMDNAVNAALDSGAQPPFILLDLHVKGDFFVFSCKNSAAWDLPRRTVKTDGLHQHGLGMKIIHSIAQRYGDLMETERGEDYYRVMLAIPLSSPDASCA